MRIGSADVGVRGLRERTAESPGVRGYLGAARLLLPDRPRLAPTGVVQAERFCLHSRLQPFGVPDSSCSRLRQALARRQGDDCGCGQGRAVRHARRARGLVRARGLRKWLETMARYRPDRSRWPERKSRPAAGTRHVGLCGRCRTADEADEAFAGTVPRTEVPAHARVGRVGRGHRFAAYPRCWANSSRRAARTNAVA